MIVVPNSNIVGLVDSHSGQGLTAIQAVQMANNRHFRLLSENELIQSERLSENVVGGLSKIHNLYPAWTGRWICYPEAGKMLGPTVEFVDSKVRIVFNVPVHAQGRTNIALSVSQGFKQDGTPIFWLEEEKRTNTFFVAVSDQADISILGLSKPPDWETDVWGHVLSEEGDGVHFYRRYSGYNGLLPYHDSNLFLENINPLSQLGLLVEDMAPDARQFDAVMHGSIAVLDRPLSKAEFWEMELEPDQSVLAISDYGTVAFGKKSESLVIFGSLPLKDNHIVWETQYKHGIKYISFKIEDGRTVILFGMDKSWHQDILDKSGYVNGLSGESNIHGGHIDETDRTSLLEIRQLRYAPKQKGVLFVNGSSGSFGRADNEQAAKALSELLQSLNPLLLEKNLVSEPYIRVDWENSGTFRI